MKKLFVFLLTVCLLTSAVQARGGSNWYFLPTKDSSRPSLPPHDIEAPGEGAILLGPDERRVYLTFDAGYVNENVLRITEVLEREQVPATFFILRQVVKENSDLIARWKQAGMLVGNHTLTHANCARLTREELKREMTSLADLYRETTGIEMDKFFRPPEGSYTRETVETALSLGYRTVFWSVAYADWDNDRQKDPSSALSLVLSRTHNGAVVLLHPTSATNAAILEDYIKTLKSEGYTFGSLEELS